MDYGKYCGKHYIIYGKYCGPHCKGGKWTLKSLEMLLWMHTTLQNIGGLCCRFWYFYWMKNNVHAKDSQSKWDLIHTCPTCVVLNPRLEYSHFFNTKLQQNWNLPFSPNFLIGCYCPKIKMVYGEIDAKTFLSSINFHAILMSDGAYCGATLYSALKGRSHYKYAIVFAINMVGSSSSQ